MRAVYLTVKYITIVGTFLQGFFEHLSCRMYDVLIEDGRYLRSNEMCGHIEHELIKKRGTAFGVCFFPFLFNLLIGLILTAAGSVNIFYLGEFFMSADSKVPNFPNFLFLWVGISCLTNLFPQIEDALTLKEQIYGKGKSNLFVKIIAAPICMSAHICRASGLRLSRLWYSRCLCRRFSARLYLSSTMP